MNYVGCSAKHKNFAELYLRESYKADWSRAAVEKPSRIVPRPQEMMMSWK
jgi:hypothetical protein